MKMQEYLNIENINRSKGGVEYHPLIPFLPRGCKVLFLGSFPPQRKRWCMDFFYPNWINDHWRIEGLLFYDDKNHFVDEAHRTFLLPDIVDFLNNKGIGFFDTATAVRRLKDNASDAHLEIVEHTDLHAILARIPECKVIVTTGEKATKALCETLCIDVVPKMGEWTPITTVPDHPDLVLYRLPSSSRAYPLALPRKAEYYRQMFTFAGLL